MPDRRDRTPGPGALTTATSPALDAERLCWAAARLRTLEGVEARLLAMAVEEEDDTVAAWMEWWAHTAWLDAGALRAEHGLDGARAQEGGD